jgi:hypothetical protein
VLRLGPPESQAAPSPATSWSNTPTTWRATGQTSGWSLKTPMTNLKVSETGAQNVNHGQQTPSIRLSMNISAPSPIVPSTTCPTTHATDAPTPDARPRQRQLRGPCAASIMLLDPRASCLPASYLFHLTFILSHAQAHICSATPAP